MILRNVPGIKMYSGQASHAELGTPVMETRSSLDNLVECRWSRGNECASELDNTVREREAELGGEDLLDVRSANISSLLDFGYS